MRHCSLSWAIFESFVCCSLVLWQYYNLISSLSQRKLITTICFRWTTLLCGLHIFITYIEDYTTWTLVNFLWGPKIICMCKNSRHSYLCGRNCCYTVTEVPTPDPWPRTIYTEYIWHFSIYRQKRLSDSFWIIVCARVCAWNFRPVNGRYNFHHVWSVHVQVRHVAVITHWCVSKNAYEMMKNTCS